MRIVKLLLVGACITAISASFADSKSPVQPNTKIIKQQPALSFTVNKTYICPGIAPINVSTMSNVKVYAAIAKHLNTMTKMPSEYKCTFKVTHSSSQPSKTDSSTSTGFWILKNPSVSGNEKSGFILMADMLIQDSAYTSKGTGPQLKSSSTGKSHLEISNFNSLKNQLF